MVEPQNDVLIEARGLAAGYAGMAVVRELDLTVRAGEVVALLGPNGAGKSTTLLTLAGVLPAIAGEVLWRGRATTEGLHLRAKAGLGFVPEQRAVLMSMSVRDNLKLGLGGIEGALELFPELEPLLGRRGGLLSGGEQQMLCLARMLASRPSALLVDELSLGLAPLVVRRLMRAIRTAADDHGIGVLMVEQQAKRALDAADRYVLMSHGRIVRSGAANESPADLRSSYLSGEVAGRA